MAAQVGLLSNVRSKSSPRHKHRLEKILQVELDAPTTIEWCLNDHKMISRVLLSFVSLAVWVYWLWPSSTWGQSSMDDACNTRSMSYRFQFQVQGTGVKRAPVFRCWRRPSYCKEQQPRTAGRQQQSNNSGDSKQKHPRRHNELCDDSKLTCIKWWPLWWRGSQLWWAGN